MTCDEVRSLLPEHVLGTLEGPEDLEVRRHLRGCAACRADAEGLGEGMVLFSRASHDRRPPAELRDRVLTVLEEEWRDAPRDQRPSARWKALVAVAALIAGLSIFAGVQSFRANEFQQGNASYHNILNILGGKDFRVGTLSPPTDGVDVSGNIILYDAHTDQSWGLLIVHAPGYSGTATATLTSSDGHSIHFVNPLRFDAAGDASTYMVSTASLESFAKVTVFSSDGSVMATAAIVTES